VSVAGGGRHSARSGVRPFGQRVGDGFLDVQPTAAAKRHLEAGVPEHGARPRLDCFGFAVAAGVTQQRRIVLEHTFKLAAVHIARRRGWA